MADQDYSQDRKLLWKLDLKLIPWVCMPQSLFFPTQAFRCFAFRAVRRNLRICITWARTICVTSG